MTLDDYFGHNHLAELGELSRELDLMRGRVEAGSPMTPEDQRRANQIANRMHWLIVLITEAVQAARAEQVREPFFQTLIVKTVEGHGPLMARPGEGRTWFKVRLLPSLGVWLTGLLWELRASIEEGVAAFRKTVDRLAAFVRVASEHCHASIQQAMAGLRRGETIIGVACPSSTTARDLIARLTSPAILSAGGQGASHIPRC